MTHDFHARDAQPSSPSDGDAAAAPSGYGADTTLIALAERLFELNQLRAEQFGDLLFASPAIDVMLALYIAYHDDRHADTQNIRAKCDLRPLEYRAMVEELAERDLVQVYQRDLESGIFSAQISALGKARVDAFLIRIKKQGFLTV